MQALRQREEALLSMQALRDEADVKADSVAQLEAEGSKVGSETKSCRRVHLSAIWRAVMQF